MNRKIFTLLLGAFMFVSSAFTVNAQVLLPYTPKTTAGDVNFNDKLTTSFVDRLPAANVLSQNTTYMLLSVTGIANATAGPTNLQNLIDLTSSLVLSIDNYSADIKRLRLEYLEDLDWEYNYLYKKSNKFGALRHSLWCPSYYTSGVAGSNVYFNFVQMETGLPLLSPIIYNQDAANPWVPALDGTQMYQPAINMLDGELIVNGWHFTQVVATNQDVQKHRPIFSYVNKDTVAVFVLPDGATWQAPTTTSGSYQTGGWPVTVKHVAVNDLLMNAAGDVRPGKIENVLLFSFKKVNKFVMNANDWNSVNTDIVFNPLAKVEVTNADKGNKYINPFTTTNNPLEAFEVNDDLYHYGYMQFQRKNIPITETGSWLYVDTAWVNFGNNQYLAFGWSVNQRDNTALGGSFPWGGSFGPAPVKSDYLPTDGIFYKLDQLLWTTLTRAVEAGTTNAVPLTALVNATGAMFNSHSTAIEVEFDPTEAADWNAIIAEAAALGINVTGFDPAVVDAVPYSLFSATGVYPDGALGSWVSVGGATPHYRLRPGFAGTLPTYAAEIALFAKFDADVAKFALAYLKDSIMENQSKFRVVYDPTADSTFINVYQTRVRYPDFRNGSHNATWPTWWTNSFGFDATTGKVIRPSDLWTNTDFYGDPLIAAGQVSIEEAAADYYDRVVLTIGYYGTTAIRRADVPAPTAGITFVTGPLTFEGHGQGPKTYDITGGANVRSVYNLHSFMEFYPQSSLPGMDKVLISTADTVRIWRNFDYQDPPVAGSSNFSALAHMYGWSMTNASPNGELYYRDSLFYIDIQNLENADRTIITLDQSYKNGNKLLDTQIKINFGAKCKLPDPADGKTPATIDNDLYLIRNTEGKYLAVPLWSITDSIYWVPLERYEDPTRMPSYQWAVMNLRQTAGSPFRLANREFEHVQLPYVYAFQEPHPFDIAGIYKDASFNKKKVVGKATTKDQALASGSIQPTRDFVDKLEQMYALGQISFIRLGTSVKEDQTIGYKYIDKDETYIDVYAFKLSHFLASQPKYLSWAGYNTKDTTLWAIGETYYDKLYFNLQEMTPLDIGFDADKSNLYNGLMTLNAVNANDPKHDNYQFQALYKKYTDRVRLYTNADEMVLERFGFWETNTGIANLKPMARQAYRLFLQDYYRWHPTQKGHYVTVGEQDRYILSDKANASRPYVKGSGRVEGLFGIPFFYFRNTFFDVTKAGDDYFALIQRIDTLRRDIINHPLYPQYFEFGGPTYGDIEDYMTLRYSSTIAKLLLKQIRTNREFALALLDIDQSTGKAKFVLRGDGATASNISAFQLERDEDPIYRRFHVNEPGKNWYPELGDTPDTLEFHLLNEASTGFYLYENSGNYLDAPSYPTDRFGRDGGRVFNLDKDVNGDYRRDTLKNVLSFLGASRKIDFPETKRSFFVDTAFINRGTGWIKPQYLLAVDPYNPIEDPGCTIELGPYDSPNKGKGYVIARYLYNTAQYTKAVKDAVLRPDFDFDLTDVPYTIGTQTDVFKYRSDNFSKVEPIKDAVMRNPNGAAYSWDGKWERLAFTWAIHFGDSLYVLKGVEPGYTGTSEGDPQLLFEKLVKEYGGGKDNAAYLDFGKLLSLNTSGTFKETYYPLGDRSSSTPVIRNYNTFKTLAQVKSEGRTIGLHAVINLADNTHKDWVFSFRYVERGSSDFVIESETTERNTQFSAVIRPGYGGWVKFQNGVPVITRSDVKDNMGQAQGSVMNVNRVLNPVGNEEVGATKASVLVVGGAGVVTVQNAAGKKVVVSNVLGQTIANVTLSTNNASIAAPAGFVVVAVEGEAATKVLVK